MVFFALDYLHKDYSDQVANAMSALNDKEEIS